MPVNPAYFSYVSDADVEALAGPSALFIASYANLTKSAFQRAREKGAIVLVYRMMQEVPNTVSNPVQLEWFMGDPRRVPRWPYRTPDGQPRSNWPNTQLCDIRANSPWVSHVEDQIAKLIQSKLADGVFSDGHGARVWSKSAAWETWPTAEQSEWALANVDVARRMDTVRRQLDERFQIVHNNIWFLPVGHPSKTAALEGENYCDGVCIEHHPPTREFHVNYVTKPFGNLQQRRVIIIANNLTEAQEWATKPGVTHVASVDKTKGEGYLRAVAVPGIACTDIRLGELQAYVERREAEIEALRAQADDVGELTARLAAVESDLAKARECISVARAVLTEAA